MFKILRNTRYYLSEVKTILKLNGISSLLSIISLALIFFITTLTLSGWWISMAFTTALEDEAEISAYYAEVLNEYSLDALIEEIRLIPGVKNVTSISAETSYERMSTILGQEAKILSQFDENPFEPYLEVSIELGALDNIIDELNGNAQLEYIRDNRTILEKIGQIASIVAVLGVIMTLAVGISTFIITSHIIREGVHAHEDQINTLQLLGAPDLFIHMPFIIEGTLLSLLSGVFATLAYSGFAFQIGKFTEGVFPFMPAIDSLEIVGTISLGTIIVSGCLGLVASLFGLKLIKNK